MPMPYILVRITIDMQVNLCVDVIPQKSKKTKNSVRRRSETHHPSKKE